MAQAAQHANDTRAEGSETQPLNPEFMNLKDASTEIRKGFVRKVYGILCAQLVLTVIIAAPIALSGRTWIKTHVYVMYIALAANIACLCAMMCAGQLLRQYPTNYIFLFILTVVTSVMVGFVSAMYTWQSVVMAAAATLLVFILLTCYAWVTESDFTGMGPYIFCALCILIVFGFFISILQLSGVHVKSLILGYDIIGVCIFCFFIIYDTQLILGEWGGHKESFSVDDYCFAALALYLDIINLFLFLLEIFGDRK